MIRIRFWAREINSEIFSGGTVCICSQFPAEVVLWIKEVEMVESVDDLKSSRSIRGTHEPDFEVLDARMLQHSTESSRIPPSRKRSIWRN